MTPKKTSEPTDEDSLGVLDDAASLDTTTISALGQTAQVNVELPRDEDDDLVDDAVVDGEIPAELIIEDAPVAADVEVGKIQEDISGIVIEVPAEELPAATSAADVSAGHDTIDAEVEEDAGPVAESEKAADAEKAAEPEKATPDAVATEPAASKTRSASETVKSATKAKPTAGKSKPTDTKAKPAAEKAKPAAEKAKPAAKTEAAAKTESAAKTAEPAAKTEPAVKKVEPAAKTEPAVQKAEPAKNTPEPTAKKAAASATTASRSESATSAWIANAMKQDAAAATDTTADESTAVSAQPATEKAESADVSTPENEPKPRETSIAPRSATQRPEVELTSKRLGDQLGQSSRESADLLTADRLLDPHQVTKPEPEGAWSHFLYTISGRLINIGDGRRARERKALTARIAAPLTGGARFVPVLSRKGGVGKTAVTALLGMALADARDDRVIAVDANPDRGTLADRIVRSHAKSVRDLVRIHDEVKGYHDISAIVARDSTRLDVLASDADPRVAEAFSDADYRDVAAVAAHYYSLVLTDTGTGIVHSVMGATLDLADQLVIVSGLSVDEARLASETLTWLESNGHAERARNAIIVLNQSTPGSPLVRLNELEAHFGTRAKNVVRMPYDAQIAGGGAITFANLNPETRQAARELAALLVEGLRASVS